MAFHIRDFIKYVQKLKRWYEGYHQHSQTHPYQQPHQPFEAHSESHYQGPSDDSHYTDLRNQAIQEGNLMKQKFDEAHQAYTTGARGKAKQLSNEGKLHQKNRDEINHQAAEWIFKENNRHSPPDTIDLHGLYVQESISYTESFITNKRRKGDSRTLRVIVGKGLHSAHNAPRIKPAIEEMVIKYNLAVHLDPHNAGVLLIDFDAGKAHRGLDQGLRERLDKLAGNPCSLM